MDTSMDERASLHPLRLARFERCLTQQMLADFTELSVPTIKRAEAGRPLRIDVHYRLCQFFGKTSQELGLRYQVRPKQAV
jgi:DNA-binding XRE family transcriptional regulator